MHDIRSEPVNAAALAEDVQIRSAYCLRKVLVPMLVQSVRICCALGYARFQPVIFKDCFNSPGSIAVISIIYSGFGILFLMQKPIFRSG